MKKINFFANTKYESEYEKAKRAKSNVESSSSSLLERDINNIKSSISGIDISSSWNDSCSILFEENKSKCLNKVDEILTSINSYFKKSEELYILLFQQIELLKTADELYQEKFISEPKKSDYQEEVINSSNNTTYTRTKDSYYKEHDKWETTIKELENSCKEIQSKIDKCISLLNQINGITLSSNISINVPNLTIPSSISVLDYSSLPEDFKFDINVLFDGKEYIIFSQAGHGAHCRFCGTSLEQYYKKCPKCKQSDCMDLLRENDFIFTDRNAGANGFGTKVAGAACSQVAFLNGMVELFPYNDVLKMYGIDKLTYTDYSNNEAVLLTINDKLTENWHNLNGDKTNSDKIKGLEFTYNSTDINKYVNINVRRFQDLSNEEKDKLFSQMEQGNAFIECRSAKNTGSGWTHTGNGHYYCACGVKDVNGTKYILVKDSAVSIDNNDYSLNTYQSKYDKSRISWRPLQEAVDHLSTSGNNVIIVTKKV